MQKGFGSVFIVSGLFIILVIGGIGFWIVQYRLNSSVVNSPESNNNQRSSPSDDILKATPQGSSLIEQFNKGSVNHINAQIEIFNVRKGYYPRSLVELRSEFNIDDEEFDKYNSKPFVFEPERVGYKFYLKSNNGENYYGEKKEVEKFIDASVWVDINGLMGDVGSFYMNNKRLPKSLEELAANSKFKDLVLRKNPYTGKINEYISGVDGRSFTVSGQVSNGEKYTRENKEMVQY